MPISMPKHVWLCAAVVVSTALGCGESDEPSRDGGQSDENALVCEGDRYSTGEMMKGPLADCTIVTGDLILTSNDPSIELPILTRVDGSLSIWGNAATHVALPKLTSVGGRVDISYNAALTSLELPALEAANERAVSTVWDLSISDNALLPTCQADAIRDHLRAKGFDGSIGISGNLGTCPR